MNKLRGTFLALIVIALIGCFFINWKEKKPLFQPEIYTPTQQVEKSAVANASIMAVNSRADSLRDFKCSLTAKIYRRITINLTGGILFEKPKQSSVYFDSRLGREVYVGSNSDEFWFYSKRMDDPALYYAKHEDLYRTRLKAPFHPIWLMQGLGLEPLKFTVSPRFEKDGDNLRIVSDEKGPNGKFIRRVVLIDTNNNSVRGNYLYDENNKLVASIEINSTTTASNFIVPQKLRLVWVNGDDKNVMDMELKDITVNTGRKSVIKRPTNYGPQIDMTKD